MFLFRSNPFLFRRLVFLVAVCFAGLSFSAPAYGQQFTSSSTDILPVSLESAAIMRGFRIYADRPFVFDFLIEPAANAPDSAAFQQETQRLIRYFLAALTIPEQDLWVNLSPFEKDRIIPEFLGRTELGQTMLQQDYELKKLTASYLSPENKVGKSFWDEVYEQVYRKYEITEIPLDSFNKIWIVPDRINFYQTGDTIIITESHLKLFLQEDYLAFQGRNSDSLSAVQNKDINSLVSRIIAKKVLPFLEKEINSGETFSPLRQVFHSVALGVWLKRQFSKTSPAAVYLDGNKITGIDYFSGGDTHDLYQRYADIFNSNDNGIVAESYDAGTQSVVVKRYASGGFDQTDVLNKANLVGAFQNVPVVPVHTALGLNLAMLNPGETNAVSLEVSDNIHRGKTVLVTGGDGFIGMALVKKLKSQECDVVILSHDVQSEIESFLKKQNVSIYKVDITNPKELSEAVKTIHANKKIDAVVHLAGAIRPPESVHNPVKYYSNNVIGTSNLLKVMDDLGISNIVTASSAAVYHGSDDSNDKITERSPINIRNPYTATKIFIERILKDRAGKGKGRSILLRIANVGGANQWNHEGDVIWYGPNRRLQVNGRHQKVAMAVISSMIQIILKKRKSESVSPFLIFGDPVRDFLHVDDVAAAFLQSLAFLYHHEEKLENQSLVFNLGSGIGTSIEELVKETERIAGENIQTQKREGRSSEVSHLVIDSSLAQKDLNWKPMATLEEIIKSTLNYHEQTGFNDFISTLTIKEESDVAQKIVTAIDSDQIISPEFKFEILFYLFTALINPERTLFKNKQYIDTRHLKSFYDVASPSLAVLKEGELLEILQQDKDAIWAEFKNVGQYLQQASDFVYLKQLHDTIMSLYNQISSDSAELSGAPSVNGGIDLKFADRTWVRDANSAFVSVDDWGFPSFVTGLVAEFLQIGNTQSLRSYLINLP